MNTELGLKLFHRGKVRDTYELDGHRLLMIATDRISAFDRVLPNRIPDRGKVLTQVSVFWFSQTSSLRRSHLISGMIPDLPAEVRDQRDELAGRFMIVHRAKRIDIECVVRGYLAGSGWAEYQESGTLAGEKLPAGLLQSQQLPTPIFSPATKEDNGHDRNITYAEAAKLVGKKAAAELKAASLELYQHAAEQVSRRGLILADTKFEFGRVNGELVLIDEILTPDSSRYWDRESWRVGASPESYDKQPVRDWLSGSGWDRESEPPALPAAVVEQTRERYLVAYHRIVGKPFFPPKERV
jgi:phosphoribosylaminoimidazole-succinocarboxamide synthase